MLPHWARGDGDAERRWLVFAHEAEHLRAGDPRLLGAAAALVALAPWSPAGWWMLARLRGAIELDCDARVLARAGRRGVSDSTAVARYGILLLDVAARPAAATHPRAALTPALAGSARTTLERRIRQMTAPRPSGPGVRAAAFTLGTFVAAADAAALPAPAASTPATAARHADVTRIAPRQDTGSTRRASADSILVVIDGRTVGRGKASFAKIPPDSIESVDVLKGPAAIARYGEAGRAGVVIITRKKAAG